MTLIDKIISVIKKLTKGKSTVYMLHLLSLLLTTVILALYYLPINVEYKLPTYILPILSRDLPLFTFAQFQFIIIGLIVFSAVRGRFHGFMLWIVDREDKNDKKIVPFCINFFFAILRLLPPLCCAVYAAYQLLFYINTKTLRITETLNAIVVVGIIFIYSAVYIFPPIIQNVLDNYLRKEYEFTHSTGYYDVNKKPICIDDAVLYNNQKYYIRKVIAPAFDYFDTTLKPQVHLSNYTNPDIPIEKVSGPMEIIYKETGKKRN